MPPSSGSTTEPCTQAAHFLTLKLEVVSSSEISVNVYQTIQHNISEDYSLQYYCQLSHHIRLWSLMLYWSSTLKVIPVRSRWTYTVLHSITSQKMVLLNKSFVSHGIEEKFSYVTIHIHDTCSNSISSVCRSAMRLWIYYSSRQQLGRVESKVK
jgi:hypothetical protein